MVAFPQSRIKGSGFESQQNIFSILVKLLIVSLRGVVVDLSGLRDRGPGFKTRSRPLTFTKADTEFQNPTRCGVLMH